MQADYVPLTTKTMFVKAVADFLGRRAKKR